MYLYIPPSCSHQINQLPNLLIRTHKHTISSYKHADICNYSVTNHLRNKAYCTKDQKIQPIHTYVYMSSMLYRNLLWQLPWTIVATKRVPLNVKYLGYHKSYLFMRKLLSKLLQVNIM